MKKLPEIHQLVVVTSAPDATMYRVVAHEGKSAVGLIDATIEDRVKNQQVQWMDRSSVEFPSVAQRRAFVGVAA